MFSKTSKTNHDDLTSVSVPASKSSSGVPSIVSADLTVKGDLESDGDIQIDGRVVGDINSRTLTIGEGAHVEGAVAADTVRVAGSVSGQIHGANVLLTKTAKVNGDIVHQSLAIEAGAYVEGNIRRSDQAPSAGQSIMTRRLDSDEEPLDLANEQNGEDARH